MTPNQLFKKLKSGQSLDSTIDFLFDTIDNKLINNEKGFVEEFLKIVNVKEIPIDISVGILSICFSVKNDLKNYQSFYDRCFDYFFKKEGKERAQGLLSGFERK